MQILKNIQILVFVQEGLINKFLTMTATLKKVALILLLKETKLHVHLTDLTHLNGISSWRDNNMK